MCPIDPFLPTFQNLCDLGISWTLAVFLLLLGAAAVGRRPSAPIQIGAGWGVVCLILTGWGVLIPANLAIPAALLGCGALGVLALPTRRPSWEAWVALGRMAVISLPFWLVLAPIRPAEPDTWLNLLPNAVYLGDWGRLPRLGLPPSHSFLPAAPYNTQFLSYLGHFLDPDYPPGGMSLTNLLLLLTAGLLLARWVTPAGRSSGWTETAVGLLLASLFNPGFVPRIHLAAYGETGLAVTALLAAYLFVEAQSAHAEKRRSPGLLLPLALILAAMVNVKQSGVGLVAACAAAALASGFLERSLSRRQTIAFTVRAISPSALLYLLWRSFVATAGVDELKPLPFSEWQWLNLPAIGLGILHTMLNKGLYFGAVLLAIAALPILLRRDGWTGTTRFLAFHAALFCAYFGFLLLTYIGHFPGAWSTEAHSFFRYETHLSLVLVAALVAAARALGAGQWFSQPGILKIVRPATLVLALGAPILFVLLLRFDLAEPQPLVWNLAKNMAPYLKDGDRLALLLPGDNGSVATMLSGVLADTAPRRRDLDLWIRDRADPGTLDQAAAAGYSLALVSCTPVGLYTAPPNQAVLMRHGTESWQVVAVWPYPAIRSRWQHILSWAPLCRDGE